VQEAVVVMKDIFRKYPHSYEGVIPTLCANLDELDEPEAKASLIWIIGEYAEKIDNASELLGVFVDTFLEEAYPVQLQTLTAVVKLYMKKPDSAQGVVSKVLETATKDCDSPDVRDRAYIYWRLLSTDPNAAKAVILASRPPITLAQTTVPRTILEELLGEIGSLASVYHKPADTFVGRGRVGADSVHKKIEGQEDEVIREKALQTLVAGQQAENLLEFDDVPAMDGEVTGLAATTAAIVQSNAGQKVLTSSNPLDDLASIFGSAGLSVPQNLPMASSPTPIFPSAPAAPPRSNGPSVPSKPQDDLLGLF